MDFHALTFSGSEHMFFLNLPRDLANFIEKKKVF